MPELFPFKKSAELKRAQELLTELRKSKYNIPAPLIIAIQGFLEKYRNFKTMDSTPEDMVYTYPGEEAIPAKNVDTSIQERNLLGLIKIMQFVQQNPELIPYRVGTLTQLGVELDGSDIDSSYFVVNNSYYSRNGIFGQIEISLGMQPYQELPANYLKVELANIIASPKGFAQRDLANTAKRVYDKFQQFSKLDSNALNRIGNSCYPSRSINEIVSAANHNLMLFVSIMKFLQENPTLTSNPDAKIQQALEDLNKCFKVNDVYEYSVTQSFYKPAKAKTEMFELAAKLGVPNDPNFGYNYVAVFASKPLQEQIPKPLVQKSFLARFWQSIKNFFSKLFTVKHHHVEMQTAPANATTNTVNNNTTKTNSESRTERIIKNVRNLFTPQSYIRRKEDANKNPSHNSTRPNP